MQTSVAKKGWDFKEINICPELKNYLGLFPLSNVSSNISFFNRFHPFFSLLSFNDKYFLGYYNMQLSMFALCVFVRCYLFWWKHFCVDNFSSTFIHDFSFVLFCTTLKHNFDTRVQLYYFVLFDPSNSFQG